MPHGVTECERSADTRRIVWCRDALQNLEDPQYADLKKFAEVVESYYRTASQSYKAMLMFVKNVNFLSACTATDEAIFTGMLTQLFEGAEESKVMPDTPLAEVEIALMHNANQMKLVVEGLKQALQCVGGDVVSMTAAVATWRKVWVKKEVKNAKKKPEEIIPFLMGVIGADVSGQNDVVTSLKKFYSDKAWKKTLTEVDLFNFVNRMINFCMPQLGGSAFGENERRAMVAYYPNNLHQYLDFANCVIDEVNEIFANSYGATNDVTACLTELDLLMAELTYACTFTVKGKEKIPNSVKECFRGLVKAVKQVNKKGRVYFVPSGTADKPGYELAAIGKTSRWSRSKRIVLPISVVAAVDDISETMILKSRYQHALDLSTKDINEVDRNFHAAWGRGSVIAEQKGGKTEMSLALEGHPEESTAKSAATGNCKNVRRLYKKLKQNKKKAQLLKESDLWAKKVFIEAKSKDGSQPQSIKGYMRDTVAAKKVKAIASMVIATLFADAPTDTKANAKETQKLVKEATKWLLGELEAAGINRRMKIKDPAARKRFVVWAAQITLVQYKVNVKRLKTQGNAGAAEDFDKQKVARNTESSKAVLNKVTKEPDAASKTHTDATVTVLITDEDNRKYLEGGILDEVWAGFAPYYDLGGFDDYPTLMLTGHPIIDVLASECVYPFAQITRSLLKINEAIDAFVAAAAALGASKPGKKKYSVVSTPVFDAATAVEAVVYTLVAVHGATGTAVNVVECTQAEKADFSGDAAVRTALQRYAEYQIAIITHVQVIVENVEALSQTCKNMEAFTKNPKDFNDSIMKMPVAMLNRDVPDNNLLQPFPNVRAPSRMRPEALETLLSPAFVSSFVKETLASAYEGECGVVRQRCTLATPHALDCYAVSLSPT